MSKYRYITVIFILALLLFVVSTMSARGQVQYEVQFIEKGENRSAVVHNEFPQTEIQFRILKDGLSYNCKWLHNDDDVTDDCKEEPEFDFQLLEDGRNVPIDFENYTFTPVPLDVTIVYQLNDRNHSSSKENGKGNPLQAIQAIESQVSANVRFRNLCLTVVREGEPPCVPVYGVNDIVNKFGLAIDGDSGGEFTDVDRNRIWESIQSAHTGEEWHMVIWFLDDDLDTGNHEHESLLPAESGYLASLKARKIELVIIDLMPSSDIQKDRTWVMALGAADIPHYKTTGNPDNFPGGCDDPWLKCIKQVVEERKSSIHSISYSSTLFDDNSDHSIRLQLIEKKVNRDSDQVVLTSVIGHERSDFNIVPYFSQSPIILKEFVRFFSVAFNLVALCALLMVLILIERPE